jgi:hypothetical protein
MSLSRAKSILCVAIAIAAPQWANAAVVTLSFEGLQDQEQILDFYNGGTGSLGSSGPNHGIGFGSSALALIDSDAGGTGNFANEPSPDTIAFFLTGSDLVMNVAAGFDTGFSFFYSTATTGSVTVYSGLNGTGAVLGVLPLAPIVGVGTFGGDPTGFFDRWDPVGVAFAGTAMSVSFAGAADQIGFDNITLGSETPGGAGVPEPTTFFVWALLLSVAAGRRYYKAA